MKAKTMQVFIRSDRYGISGQTVFVEAQTKAGAIRDAIDAIADDLRKTAIADLATGEQIYNAGKAGQDIIGSGRFKRSDDPNQMGLDGIPETGGPLP